MRKSEVAKNKPGLACSEEGSTGLRMRFAVVVEVNEDICRSKILMSQKRYQSSIRDLLRRNILCVQSYSCEEMPEPMIFSARVS